MTDRVTWGSGRKGALINFIDHDVRRALTQRTDLETLWRQYLTDYRAPKQRGIASYPFEGAHNLTIPVTAMNIDPILARWMSNIHATENLWTLRAMKPAWIDAIKPLQRYMTWLDKMILKMWDVNYRVFNETLKLGTGIYKTGWLHEQRRKWGYDESKTRTRLLETRSQPFVDHVHLADFLLPPEARNIDPDAQMGATWVAERHRWRIAQLDTMSKGQEPVQPNFDPEAVLKVRQHFEANLTDHQQTIQQLDDLTSTLALAQNRQVEIWEIYTRFDTTGDGFEDDIKILYHIQSRQILQATYATGERPYTAIRYMRGDGFYGIGIAEQGQVFQETISRVTNFDMDRMLISNTPMLAVKEGANVIPDEPLFPGKQWHLNDPKNDIQSLFMAGGNGFDAANVRAYLESQVMGRTGLTDLQQGTVGALPSRTPATTVQSLLQEGNTRLDLSIKDLRQTGLSEVGLRILQSMQRQIGDPVNNPDAQMYMQLPMMILGPEEGALAAAALSIPGESIEQGIGVQLTATSGLNNKELSRQSNLALIQIVSQLAPGFLQLAQTATQGAGTPTGQVAEQLFKGGAILLERLFDDFDVVNPDEIVPTLQATLGAQAQVAAGQQIQPLGGQSGPPAGPQGF